MKKQSHTPALLAEPSGDILKRLKLQIIEASATAGDLMDALEDEDEPNTDAVELLRICDLLSAVAMILIQTEQHVPIRN